MDGQRQRRRGVTNATIYFCGHVRGRSSVSERQYGAGGDNLQQLRVHGQSGDLSGYPQSSHQRSGDIRPSKCRHSDRYRRPVGVRHRPGWERFCFGGLHPSRRHLPVSLAASMVAAGSSVPELARYDSALAATLGALMRVVISTLRLRAWGPLCVALRCRTVQFPDPGTAGAPFGTYTGQIATNAAGCARTGHAGSAWARSGRCSAPPPQGLRSSSEEACSGTVADSAPLLRRACGTSNWRAGDCRLPRAGLVMQRHDVFTDAATGCRRVRAAGSACTNVRRESSSTSRTGCGSPRSRSSTRRSSSTATPSRLTAGSARRAGVSRRRTRRRRTSRARCRNTSGPQTSCRTTSRSR